MLSPEFSRLSNMFFIILVSQEGVMRTTQVPLVLKRTTVRRGVGAPAPQNRQQIIDRTVKPNGQPSIKSLRSLHSKSETPTLTDHIFNGGRQR